MLRQEVAWFDTKSGTGKALQALNDDTLAFQAVISDRIGAFTRSITNFVAALAVGARASGATCQWFRACLAAPCD